MFGLISRFLSGDDASEYIGFTDIVFINKDPKIAKTDKDKYFISITAETDIGEDCLKTDSFYRYIVLNYLNDIRMGFNAY